MGPPPTLPSAPAAIVGGPPSPPTLPSAPAIVGGPPSPPTLPSAPAIVGGPHHHQLSPLLLLSLGVPITTNSPLCSCCYRWGSPITTNSPLLSLGVPITTNSPLCSPSSLWAVGGPPTPTSHRPPAPGTVEAPPPATIWASLFLGLWGFPTHHCVESSLISSLSRRCRGVSQHTKAFCPLLALEKWPTSGRPITPPPPSHPGGERERETKYNNKLVVL